MTKTTNKAVVKNTKSSTKNNKEVVVKPVEAVSKPNYPLVVLQPTVVKQPEVVVENKEVIVSVTQTVVLTKADKARTVFAHAYPDGKNTIMQRKDIINKMISDAGLTKAGAATYLQNMKKKAGIVQAKVTSIPQTA